MGHGKNQWEVSPALPRIEIDDLSLAVLDHRRPVPDVRGVFNCGQVRPCGRGRKPYTHLVGPTPSGPPMWAWAHEAHHRVASSVGSARAPGAHPSTYVTFGGFTASVDNSARVPGEVSKRRSRHVGYHSSAQDPEVCSPIINAVSASDAHRCHVPLASGALGSLHRQGSVMSHSDSDRARHRRLLNSFRPAACCRGSRTP